MMIPMRGLVAVILLLLLPACASFQPKPDTNSFLARQKSETQGNVTVHTAVLTRQEATDLFDVDLSLKQIQPVWIKVDNRDDHPYWLISSALDPEYFSPAEVAYTERRWFQSGYNEELERYFTKQSFRNPISPNSVTSGFIFVNLDEDEKELDIDLISKKETKFFDFYFELSELKAQSLAEVEQNNPKNQRKVVNEQELRRILQQLPCCTTSEDGKKTGDPLNLVLIGDASTLFPPFVRRGWHHSEDSYLGSIWKTINSFIFGKHYRYSPVSSLYYQGRKQDIALQKARGTIHQRNHMRLWLTDYEFDGKEVWVGQISRDIGVRFTWHTPTFTTHKIDPDIDETRTAFIEDMLFSQGLSRIGFVKGVEARTP